MTKERLIVQATALPHEKVLVISDAQVPYHDVKLMKAICAYARDHFWAGIVWVGDVMEFNEISSFVEMKPGAVGENTVSRSFSAGNRYLDDYLEAARHRNPNCRAVFIQGNHEYRTVSYTHKRPELGETLDVQANLHLADRKVEWIPFWEKGTLLKWGKAYFGHGRYTSTHHASRHARMYGEPFYYGHTHDVQEWSMVREASGKVLEAASLGCTCRYDLPYTQGRPTNWQQAFGVFYFLPNGFFNRYTVRAFNGRFVSPEGGIYVG